MPTARRFATALQVIVVIVVVLAVNVWISGYYVFQNAPSDELQHADAIVVLGGEHDGREDYGIHLGKAGWASTVVLSNPYGPDDVMDRVCRDTHGEHGPVEILCPVPDPLTTRGEALMMRRLADTRGWSRIIVVSWRYHLPRAALVFRQCFAADPRATVFRAVPRRYEFSPTFWEFSYAYQWGGLAKAFVLGECS